MAVLIASLNPAQVRLLLPQLLELLHDAVESGASVGFLPPLPAAEAQDYWQSVIAAIEAGHRVMLVAQDGPTGRVLGTVQLGATQIVALPALRVALNGPPLVPEPITT